MSTLGRALGPLFSPRRIAVVGASHTPGKLGTTMAQSLAPFDPDGRAIALVNRRGDGFHPSIPDAAADGPIDLAIFCVPAPACPELIEELSLIHI